MNLEKPCRHEYVRIFQRKLKGLERRMVATRLWLPVGFKIGDFGHLSEGSFCFCATCRARLYPKRSQAEKAAARLALALGKAAQTDIEALEEGLEGETLPESVQSQEGTINTDIHVEELELESVDVQDIEAEGVKLADDGESCNLTGDEDL